MESVLFAVCVLSCGGGLEIKKSPDEIKVDKICIQFDEDFTGNEGKFLAGGERVGEEVEAVIVQIRCLDSEGHVAISVVMRFSLRRG